MATELSGQHLARSVGEKRAKAARVSQRAHTDWRSSGPSGTWLLPRVQNAVKRQAISALVVIALSTSAVLHVDSASAQSRVHDTTQFNAPIRVALPPTMAAVPFGVGEHMEYDVKFSAVKVGNGSMDVADIVSVRDQPSWHTVFKLQGRALVWFKLNMLFESWFDVTSLSSRRFHEDQSYPGYKKNQTTEIFPERGMFKEGDKDEQVTVEKPLDFASFIYFMRTIPLEVGQTYTFSQYYKPDANPVIIKVARREKVTTAAGTFDALVLQPVIKTKGLFSADGKAEVWLADDSTRMMVQMKSDLSIGSINLYLAKYKLGTPAKP